MRNTSDMAVRQHATTCARARTTLLEIIDRLVIHPIDRAAYSDLQHYLDDQAWKACTSYEQLLQLPPEQVQHHLQCVLNRSA